MSTTTRLPLADKSALVSGGACSIGAEIALTLARRDAKVVRVMELLDRATSRR